MVRSAVESPALSLPVPRLRSLAVANENDGPSPQISLPKGLTGDIYSDSCTSPKPLTFPRPGASVGCSITGIMVRVIRFQSEVSLNGTTGSIKSASWTLEFSPTSKVVLFWNGTEITEAMGFCACLAISDVSSALADPLWQSVTNRHPMLSQHLAWHCTPAPDLTESSSIA